MVGQHMTDPRHTMLSAGEYTGFSDKTLRRYIAAGKLPAYRVGARKIIILQSDLDNLIRAIPVAVS